MLTCKHCSYETSYKQILTRHMKKKHPEIPIEKPVYECTYCHKSFASSINCKKHEQNKVCQKETPFSPSSQEIVQEVVQEIIESIYTQIETETSISKIKPPFLPPPHIQIPEIVVESDFEESPIKNKSLPSPCYQPQPQQSIIYNLLQSPIVKWIKYIGCALWTIRMIRLHS